MPVADTLRPAVESYGSDEEGKIWIKFNKSISTTGASGWVIKNSDGDTVYDWSAIVNGDNNKQVDISESPAGGDLNGSGKYSITLKGVKDTVKPEANTILDTTIEVDVPDTGAPNINTATWRGAGRNIIDVNFDCEVDYGTAMTRGNYRTRLDNGNFSSLPNSAKLTMQPGNTTVSIEFATAFANGRVEISAQDVEDLAGNRSAAVKEVTVKDMSNSVSVKSTAANKIEVTFTTAITAYDRSNFTLVNKNATTEVFDIIDQASISDANKKVTLTLNKDLNADGTYGGKVIAIKYNLLDYAPNYENAEPQDVVDGIAPKVLTDSFYYNGGAGGYPTTGSNRDIYLVFNEKVYTRGTTANDDISESFTSLKFGDDVKINSNYPNGTGGTLEGPDGTQVPIGWVIKYAGTDTSGSNYVYKLTFDRTSKYKGGDVYTTYNATPGFELKDGSGNTLAGNAFSSPDSIYFAGVRFVD